MDNSEYFPATSAIGSAPADAWQPTWTAPASARSTRDRGSWSGALGSFLLTVLAGLGADALTFGLSTRVQGGLLLLPIAGIFAVLVLLAPRMPSRYAAGSVMGFLVGVASPVVYFIYLLMTTPWGF